MDPVGGSQSYGARAVFLHSGYERGTYHIDPIGPATANGLTWLIENVSFCPQDGVTSPKVNAGNAEFSLRLQPTKQGHFNCRLTRDGSEEPMAYRISILTVDETSLDSVSGILDFHDASPNYVIQVTDILEAGFRHLHCDSLILQLFLWKTRRLVLTGLSEVTNILTVTQVCFKNYLYDRSKDPDLVPCESKASACTHTPVRKNRRLPVHPQDFFIVDFEEFESFVNFDFFEPMVEKNDQLYQWIRFRYRTTGSFNNSACMRARISVIDLKGRVWKSSDKYTKWVETNDTSVRFLPNFLRHWEIDRARKMLVRKDGRVRFKYEAEISFGGICSRIEKRSYDCAGRSPGSTLPQDILRAFLKQTYCDLTLRWCGRTFSVHRCIVCYRSSFFKRCYEAHVQKNAKTDLDVSCIDSELNVPEQFQRLLRFIYTGVVDSEEMNLKEFQALKKSARKWKMSISSSFLYKGEANSAGEVQKV